MHEFLRQILSGHNQFASGGLFLMLFGGAGVFLRSLPAHLWHLAERQATLSITVRDDDAAFSWVKEWFLEQRFLRRIRQVDLDTTVRGEELALLPAPGVHWFWHAGRPFLVELRRTEETKGRRERRVESLRFLTLGRDRAFLQRFVEEVVASHRKRSGNSSCLYLYTDYWAQVEAYAPRLLESVILKPGERDRLVADIERWRGARERYRRLGIPYHRGYLFYGPPGTGKTSLVSGLAAQFGMSIYALNLSELNDRTLKAAVNEVPENSLILFEDIDCMRTGQDRSVKAGKEEDRQGVTLGGLLNVVDGFHAPENVLFVMTTNHVEVLDPALLRPGRIDYRLLLGKAEESQKVELYRRFFPGAHEAEARVFAGQNETYTMAEFQGLLLAREQESSPEEAVTAIGCGGRI